MHVPLGARLLREMIAQFEDTRDLRLMGGYQAGTDPGLDRAVQFVPRIYETLRQTPEEPLSTDAFQDIARALSAEAAESAGGNRAVRVAPPPGAAPKQA